MKNETELYDNKEFYSACKGLIPKRLHTVTLKNTLNTMSGFTHLNSVDTQQIETAAYMHAKQLCHLILVSFTRKASLAKQKIREAVSCFDNEADKLPTEMGYLAKSIFYEQQITLQKDCRSFAKLLYVKRQNKLKNLTIPYNEPATIQVLSTTDEANIITATNQNVASHCIGDQLPITDNVINGTPLGTPHVIQDSGLQSNVSMKHISDIDAYTRKNVDQPSLTKKRTSSSIEVIAETPPKRKHSSTYERNSDLTEIGSDSCLPMVCHTSPSKNEDRNIESEKCPKRIFHADVQPVSTTRIQKIINNQNNDNTEPL